jgi:hypothetical protein
MAIDLSNQPLLLDYKSFRDVLECRVRRFRGCGSAIADIDACEPMEYRSV